MGDFEIIVSGGVVIVQDRSGAVRLLEDPHRDLERWLVEAGNADLDPAEIAVLLQDLAS